MNFKKALSMWLLVPICMAWLASGTSCNPQEAANVLPQGIYYKVPDAQSYVGFLQYAGYYFEGTVNVRGGVADVQGGMANARDIARLTQSALAVGYRQVSWWQLPPTFRQAVTAAVIKAAAEAVREYGSLLNAPILVIPGFMFQNLQFFNQVRIPA
jgi:hypothetical protein